jgi:thioredoxin 1
MATTTSTDETYKKLTTENKLVLVDFWAPWCSPCKALSPILESLSESIKELKVIKHNIDENPNVATAESIRSIPTLYLYKDGKHVETIVGAQSESNILNVIKKHL